MLWLGGSDLQDVVVWDHHITPNGVITSMVSGQAGSPDFALSQPVPWSLGSAFESRAELRLADPVRAGNLSRPGSTGSHALQRLLVTPLERHLRFESEPVSAHRGHRHDGALAPVEDGTVRGQVSDERAVVVATGVAD